MLSRIKNLLSKIACKSVEWTLVVYTAVRGRFNTDTARNILDSLSLEQNTSSFDGDSKRKVKILFVIPMKDRWSMTETVLRSIRGLNNENLEVFVNIVDNNSSEEETLSQLDSVAKTPGTEVVKAHYPFNFSKIINSGIAAKISELSDDDLIFILNNDIEFDSCKELQALIEKAIERPRSIMGCALFYPDGSVQHLYAQPGVKIVATHPFKGEKLDTSLKWFSRVHQVPAVTGAVMIFSRSTYEDIGAFDENLPTVGQDIDFCMRAESKGYSILVDSTTRAIHYEGKTKGKGLNYDEVKTMYSKWGAKLENYPLLIEDQSRWSEKVLCSLGEGPYPWRLFT